MPVHDAATGLTMWIGKKSAISPSLNGIHKQLSDKPHSVNYVAYFSGM
jgi:hypothetical protein